MKVAKNNNLNIHREKQRIKNEALVRRAIKHISNLGGEITFSSVSNVTYEIANAQDDEKGLTLPAISTSKIYRPIIEQAKAISSKQEHRTKAKLSVGDMQVSLYGLRVEIAKLKMDKKILTETLRETNRPIQKIENIETSLIQQTEEIHSISRSLVTRLLELELVYIDLPSLSLNVFMYDDLIVPYDALKVFYKKELDELQSKIS